MTANLTFEQFENIQTKSKKAPSSEIQAHSQTKEISEKADEQKTQKSETKTETVKSKEFGKFQEDKVFRIVKHEVGRILKGKGIDSGKLYFKVEWEARPDGTVPKGSYFPIDIVRENAPVQLLDYYIKRSVFLDKP